jgi:type IV secretory pathway VirB3-like protein
MEDHGDPRENICFVAITRPPCVYMVPFYPFLIFTTVCTYGFVCSYKMNEWGLRWVAARIVIWLGLWIVTGLAMRYLTAKEPNWWPITVVWFRTRALAVFSNATRLYGGTTYRPGPGDIRWDMNAMRDHVGWA